MKLKHVVVLGLMVIMLAPMHSFAVQSQLQTLQQNLGALQGNLQTLSEQLDALKEKIAPTASAATDMSGGGVSGHGVTGASKKSTSEQLPIFSKKTHDANVAAANNAARVRALKNALGQFERMKNESGDLYVENDFAELIAMRVGLDKEKVKNASINLTENLTMTLSQEEDEFYQFGNPIVLDHFNKATAVFPKKLTVDLNIASSFDGTQLKSYLEEHSDYKTNGMVTGQTWWTLREDDGWCFTYRYPGFGASMVRKGYANCSNHQFAGQKSLRFYIVSNHENFGEPEKIQLYTFVLGLAQAAMTPAE